MTNNNKNASGNETVRIVVDQDMVGNRVLDLEKRFAAEMSLLQNRAVVLDITQVRKIDSPGLALCVGIFKESRARGCSFVMETGPELYKFFKMFKLTSVIDIREAATA
jgi:ABC-type transporter Mla MlaB component